MVHKKYIKRGKKVFGPYLYESKRVNNKVVTSYRGKDKNKLINKTLFFSVVIFLLGLFTGMLFFSLLFPPRLSGRVALELKPAYVSGEQLSGTLSIDLIQGELLPYDSEVILQLNGDRKTYALNSLTEGPFTEGSFYIQGLSLSGEGQGYGIIGTKKIYPEINFELEIIDGSGGGRAVVQESSESEGLPASSPETEAETSVTGEAVSVSDIVKGSVNKEKEFKYNLKNGQSSRLVPESVNINGKKVDDSAIAVREEGGFAIVSTSYEETENGFGKDYLGESTVSIALDLEKAGIVLDKSATLSLQIVRDKDLIIEAQKDVVVVESAQDMQIFSVSVDVSHKRIVLGQDVKWNKKVSLSSPAKVKVELPENAENVNVISVREIDSDAEVNDEVTVSSRGDVTDIDIVIDGRDVEEELVVEEEIIEGREGEIVNEETKASVSLTGGAIRDVNYFASIMGFISGLAIEQAADNIIQTTGNVEYIEIEYITDAPYAVEKEIDKGKEVTIIGPENVLYEDVLAFTEIPETLNVRNVEKIRIYWNNENTYIAPESIEDKNGNGIYDYVEWNVEHLSNQTYTIIVITKAEHLDENRTFISDIYEQVKAQDNVWSETISDKEYVRVTFERNLTNEKDITIYPRTISGNPKIEVYEKDENVVIATFETINDNQYNKIFLTNLIGEQDTFDLRVIGGAREFDHIIDPESPTTIVSSCSTLTDGTTEYILNQSIVPSGIASGGTCINVTVANARFNCQGFSIENTTLTASAIYSDQLNVSIYNCNLSMSATSPGIGIYLLNGNNSIIKNTSFWTSNVHIKPERLTVMTIANNTFYYGATGISTGGTVSVLVNNASIINNSFNHLTTAVSLGGGERMSITNSRFTNVSTALSISGGNNHSFENNNITDARSNALSFGGGSQHTVRHNILYNINGNAFSFTASIGINSIMNNNTIDLANVGIAISPGASGIGNMVFSNFTINNSRQNAIQFTNPSRSVTNIAFDNVRIMNTNLSFRDLNITSANSDDLQLADTSIANYSFSASGGTLLVRSANKADIKFLSRVNGSGTNLSADIVVGNNTAYVNDTATNGGLNKSANVTFYNTVGNAIGSSSIILRDGNDCSSTICTNLTALTASTVIFNVTTWSNYSLLPSCLSNTCNETGSCNITTSCQLHNGLCTGNICDFTNMRISAALYTGNTNNNAYNLTLNLTGNITFLSGNTIDFSGLNGTTGGNGGIVNITVTGLFNRTNSIFKGFGGFSTGAGNGGNGGILQLNYHGLWGGSFNLTNLAGGNSSGGGTNGTNGNITYVKDTVCPKDADVNDDGVIDLLGDVVVIRNRYNNVSTEAGWSTYNDINCDNKLNVAEIAKIGFEFSRGI